MSRTGKLLLIKTEGTYEEIEFPSGNELAFNKAVCNAIGGQCTYYETVALSDRAAQFLYGVFLLVDADVLCRPVCPPVNLIASVLTDRTIYGNAVMAELDEQGGEHVIESMLGSNMILAKSILGSIKAQLITN